MLRTFRLIKPVTDVVLLPQVSGRHADVPAVQQGLDQGEDLRPAAASGPAGGQMMLRRAGSPAASFFMFFVCSGVVFCILLYD